MNKIGGGSMILAEARQSSLTYKTRMSLFDAFLWADFARTLEMSSSLFVSMLLFDLTTLTRLLLLLISLCFSLFTCFLLFARMKPLGEPVQEPYVRTREHPFFNGLVRKDDSRRTPSPPSVIQDNVIRNISRSVSDLVDTRQKASYKRAMDLNLDDSVSEVNLEPLGEASIESWSKFGKEPSLASQEIEPITGFGLKNSSYVVDGSSVWASDVDETHSVASTTRHSVEKSFSLKRMKANLSQIQLPQSAASFYHGGSPILEIIETCEGINNLNSFLTSRREDVSVGVPGKFLQAVIGQDTSDVTSVVATIMYAFYLNQTLVDDRLCTVPVINMKRADLSSHAELKWLLDSCQIDQSSLIFVDEVDLSYYDLFGSLKIVLLNGYKLPSRQETLKEAVVEIFNCTMGESVYPWVDKVTMGQESSSCTLVGEKFAMTSPEILGGRGFSRLLLAGILLDTGNLTSTRCTNNDKFMLTLLLNGAGRFGCNGLYQILRHKMYDVSDLRIVDILQKDFKKWAKAGKLIVTGSRSAGPYIGMSSIGIPVEQLIAHENYSMQEIKLFQQKEKLRLLVIVSGYYDAQKIFKREMLISTESLELMRNLLLFLNSNATRLPLKPLHQQGLREDMRAFEIDKVTSRKTIERLMDEFMGSRKSIDEFTGSRKSIDEFTGTRRSTDEFLGSSRRSTDEFLGSRRSTEVIQ